MQIFATTLSLAAMPTPRPRFRAIPVRGKTIVNTYYPKEYVEYTKDLEARLKAAFGQRATFEEPVTVTVQVILQRPKTSKLRAPKPDVDNFAKGVLDAATKAEIWLDDTQVVELRTEKRWGDRDEVFFCVEVAT